MLSTALTAWALGKIQWSAFLPRLALPADFPIPLPEGSTQVGLFLYADPDGVDLSQHGLDLASEPVFLLHCAADYEITSEAALSIAGIGLGSTCRFELFAAFAENEADKLEQTLAFGSATRLSGIIRFELKVRLPTLSAYEGQIAVQSGDDHGWMTLQVTAQTGDGSNYEFSARLLAALSVAFQFPGLRQPIPPLIVSINQISGGFSITDSQVSGIFALEGGFEFKPQISSLDLPIAAYLAPLLGDLEVKGEIAGSLDLNPDNPSLQINCQIEGQAASLDLLAMLQQVSRGLSPPPDADLPEGVPVSMGFGISSLGLRLDRSLFEFQMQLYAWLGEFKVEGYFNFSNERLSLGLQGAEIPLTPPYIDPDLITDLSETVEQELDQDHKQIYRQRVTEIKKALGQMQSWYDGDQGMEIGYELQGEKQILLKNPLLELSEIKFELPFQDPRNIQVSGSAQITGWQGPLENLNELVLQLGISADMIFFALESKYGGTTVEIPEFLPGYDGGQITLGKAMLGFSYTRRSLAVAFAGALRLPEKMVADLDSSTELGAGVRLPVSSKLAFRLDVMPVPAGPLVIPVPIFQFSLDLRQDFSPGIVDTQRCQPYWDGLQLIIPGFGRFSFKQLAFSPIYGFFPAVNVLFDGDLQIGDESNGLTVVMDDYLAIGPLFYNIPVPLMFSGETPFVNNLCYNLRLGGSSLNFNLERPLPSLSPLALFELLGLLTDPQNYPVDPEGELANSLRATLRNARISLSPGMRRLFPQMEPLVNKPVTITINAGTFITLTQGFSKVLTPLLAEIASALQNGAALDQITHTMLDVVADFDLRDLPGRVLQALPPDMRKLRLQASFAGFSASAVLILASRREILDSFDRQNYPPEPSPLPPGASIPLIGETYQDYLKGLQPVLSPPGDSRRVFSPFGPGENLLKGIEFKEFEFSDLEEVPPPLSDSLLSIQDLSPRLAANLKSRAGRLSGYLRDRFSAKLNNLLRSYSGGPLSKELQRALVGEMNLALKDVGFYTPARFQGVDLSPPVQRLLQQHKVRSLTGTDLIRLNRALLEAGRPEEFPPPLGVFVGARVRIFGGQAFRFIGYLFADGAFSLVTGVDIRPLRLEVAGIPVKLPLQFQGRATLLGRARRDGGYGYVQAQGSGSWSLIPGVLKIDAGQKIPLFLEIFSDGRFNLRGDASVVLFNNNRARLSGSLDISQTHIFIAGSFDYLAGPSPTNPLVNLHLAAQGRVGPGRQFELRGDGSLVILGKEISNIRGTVNQSGATISAHLNTGEWVVAGKPLACSLQLDLQGQVNLQKTTRPEFKLLGDGRLGLFPQLYKDGRVEYGAEIKGRGGILAQNGKIRTFLEGQLLWQNREWLGGRIELGSDGFVYIEGRTSFALNLVPENFFPNELNIADLYFKVDLGGSFTLDPEKAFAGCNLFVEWELGIQMRDPDSEQPMKQVFMIAKQKKLINVSGTLFKELIYIKQLNFLPLDDIYIPVPVFAEDSDITFYRVPYPLIGVLPMPEMLTPVDQKTADNVLYSVPGIPTVENKNVSALLEGFQVTLYLAWGDGEDLGDENDLGIVVKRYNQKEFFSFKEMFPSQ